MLLEGEVPVFMIELPANFNTFSLGSIWVEVSLQVTMICVVSLDRIVSSIFFHPNGNAVRVDVVQTSHMIVDFILQYKQMSTTVGIIVRISL